MSVCRRGDRAGATALALVTTLVAGVLAPVGAGAQERDTVAVRPAAPARDSVVGTQLPQPPLSPRRAFLTSLALPGYAQARLERPVTSALFFAVEAAGVLMLRKSLHDLDVARRYEGDSVAVRFQLDPVTREVVRDPETAQPVVAEWAPGRYTPQLVQARRTHLEDWIAVLVFNHLIAGADAFVSAQLWDVPAGVSLGVAPTARGGTAVTASFRW